MEKKDKLRKNGTFNKNHGRVRKDKFQEGGFYDPMDIVQVRYEMVKESYDGDSAVGQVADDYGISRSAFYGIRKKFEEGGLAALIPERTGPKTARKFTGDLQEYVTGRMAEDPKASLSMIVADMERETGVRVSRRTVERFRSKKKP
jgi:transposase